MSGNENRVVNKTDKVSPFMEFAFREEKHIKYELHN